MPHVYDKAKYHEESVREANLPLEQAENHALFFLRWLIEHDLMSKSFNEDGKDVLENFRSGSTTIRKVYRWWDACLVDDMLSKQGNAFAKHYFDFEHGRYLEDYEATLVCSLPSVFHVKYNEENYQQMWKIIDERYAEWKR